MLSRDVRDPLVFQKVKEKRKRFGQSPQDFTKVSIINKTLIPTLGSLCSYYYYSKIIVVKLRIKL